MFRETGIGNETAFALNEEGDGPNGRSCRPDGESDRVNRRLDGSNGESVRVDAVSNRPNGSADGLNAASIRVNGSSWRLNLAGFSRDDFARAPEGVPSPLHGVTCGANTGSYRAGASSDESEGGG